MYVCCSVWFQKQFQVLRALPFVWRVLCFVADGCMYDRVRNSKTQVGLSRAKVRDNLLVMQAFSPALFGHGPPPGPHILLRLLRGDMTRDQVDGEFDRLLEQKKLQGCETELLSMPWECKVTRIRVVHLLCLSPFA